MLKRRLKLTRKVSGSLHTAPTSEKSDVSHTIEQSHARQILNLPPEQLASLIKGLREGASPQTIAHFFGEQGWLTVTEKSFKQYIAAFRRLHPDRVRGSGTGADDKDLNFYVDPRQPDMDEEKTLQQVLRLQQSRLAIGHKIERDMGFYNKDLHKDIETTVKVIESLAAIRGGGKKAGRPGAASTPMTNEASETLRKSDAVESQQDRLIHLTSQLAPLVRTKING